MKTPNFLQSFLSKEAHKVIGSPFEIEKTGSGILLLKAKDKYFLFGLPSNNAFDGWDVITEKAHRRYVKFLEGHPQSTPLLNVFHVAGSAFGQKADWWDYTTGGFLTMLWQLEKDDLPLIDMIKRIGDPGMSIEGIATYSNWGVISYYWLNYVSILPQASAQNKYASFMTINKEKTMAFTEKKREELLEKFSPEVVKDLEEKLGESEDEISDALRMDKPAEETTEDVETDDEPAEAADAEPIEADEEPTAAEAEFSQGQREEIAAAMTEFGNEMVKQITADLETKFQLALDAVINTVKTDFQGLSEQLTLGETAPNMASMALDNLKPFDHKDGDDSARIDGRSSLAQKSPAETDPGVEKSGGIGIYGVKPKTQPEGSNNV